MEKESPAAKRAKRRVVKVTCRSDGEPCGCEDMTLAEIKRSSMTRREHQIVVAFGNKKINSNQIPFNLHSFLISEKALKSTRDQVDYVLEVNNAQTALLKEILAATKSGASFAEAAAEKKKMEEIQAEDERQLVLPWMVKVKNSKQIPTNRHSLFQNDTEVNVAMNDDEMYHATRRYLEHSKTSTKGSWLRKMCRIMFDGHLIGRYYLTFPGSP